MIHIGNNCRSRIVSKIISIGKSRDYYKGLVQVQPNYHNVRNFSQCDLMLISDQEAANTYHYMEVELICILKSLISFVDSPSCVLVSLNFIVVGLEWVKKSSIPLRKIDSHMSLHLILHTLYFYKIRSKEYNVCKTKNPSRHDESSLSMEIKTKNHKISINLWQSKKINKRFYANIFYLVQDTTNIS